MKTYIYILLLFYTCLYKYYAQTNLVKNPSFEEYSICPTWGNSNTLLNCLPVRSSPDYYNSCNAVAYSGVSTPYPFQHSFQYPASGKAYIGLYAYNPNGATNDDREFSNCELTTPLVQGTKYYVSFKVNLSGIYTEGNVCSCVATDHIGILFTTQQYTYNPSLAINNFAHVYGNTVITDTLNWTMVFGSFVADSAYNSIAIGDFFDDTHSNVQYLLSCSDSINCYYSSYYFIDDICVSTDSLLCTNYTWDETTENATNFFVPNIFTPNGDNVNDEIDFNKTGNTSQAIVYNRWGEEVFNSLKENSFIWDGKINNTDCNDGVYFAVVYYYGRNGKQQYIKQSITLIH